MVPEGLCQPVSISNIKLLLVFDVLFVIDRIMDLFVGFIQPNGQAEYRLYAVLLNNISFKFFLEIFITVAPIVLQNVYHRKSVIYALFKVVRYVRLFEIDGQVADILEYHAQSKTVFEIKQMKRTLDIL